MKSLKLIVLSVCILSLFASTGWAADKDVTSKIESAPGNTNAAASPSQKNTEPQTTNWRDDPQIRRRPASYVGGALTYVQVHTWIKANKDHKKLNYGPLHSGTLLMRVGDAFGDKFAIGFQVQSVNAKTKDVQISAFALLLDLSFYPWKGLGIRPSAGFGFGFAQGHNKWEFGFGGPGTLSFSLLYEFRITRKFTLAPVATTTWLTGDGYDNLFIFAGIEALFWLPNRHRYKE